MLVKRKLNGAVRDGEVTRMVTRKLGVIPGH